ncbi:hypothetical protein [Paludisphaera borealis]|uniref:Uncharacterized protein n=1 Tax=Paludisphaera borealis TaxID=1387353 RepID=A0A1U7CRV5_9BACT|nr:hypothetical protein [Paludisphaera borealis]APW61677.1 hypothetical protein BSF38_03202 [Paludisphaera borealis]
MSHDDLAAGKARGVARRKVSFVTTLEDLEGRVLLSAVRHVRPNHAVVRQVSRPKPKVQVKAHAQVQIPRRLQAMNALRMRNPTINIQQSVNVNPTVNVAPATANSTSNSTSNPTNTTSYHDALATAGVTPPTTPGTAGAATTTTPPPTTTPPATSTTTTPPTTPPAKTPANPSGQQGSGTWTSINNPPVVTPPSTSTPPTTTTPPPTTTPPTTTPPATSTPPTTTTPPPTNPPPVTPPPAPTFPDGTILRNEQTGELGWYSGAARHLISPPVAAKMGITQAQTTSVTATVFKAVPKGNDYFPDGMFVRNQQSGEISQYSGGVFHVVSPPIAAKLGLDVNGLATISAAQYAGVGKGPDYFPEGILLQNQQTGEVDIYQGGQRHWISVAVAARISLTVDVLTPISPTQFNAIPQGKDYFPDNVYLQNQETGEIAQYSGGKNHLVSAPVASKIGLTAPQLISVSSAQYNAIDKGPDYFVEGMFLQNNQSGEIDQYSGGQRHWVSSPVATSINLTQAQITTIGADQFNNIPRGGDYTPPPPSATAPDPAATA